MDLSEEWRKLRPALGDMICHIDSKMQSIEAEEKRIQEKRDDGYLRGLNDMALAVSGLEDYEAYKLFEAASFARIMETMTPKEFVDKYQQWKADSEELHIGDEVTVSDVAGFTYIILYRIYETEDLFKLFEPTSLLTYTYSAKSLKKTGRHFDSIPLTKGEESK